MLVDLWHCICYWWTYLVVGYLIATVVYLFLKEGTVDSCTICLVYSYALSCFIVNDFSWTWLLYHGFSNFDRFTRGKMCLDWNFFSWARWFAFWNYLFQIFSSGVSPYLQCRIKFRSWLMHCSLLYSSTFCVVLWKTDHSKDSFILTELCLSVYWELSCKFHLYFLKFQYVLGSWTSYLKEIILVFLRRFLHLMEGETIQSLSSISSFTELQSFGSCVVEMFMIQVLWWLLSLIIEVNFKSFLR